jgi:hypothetical protein
LKLTKANVTRVLQKAGCLRKDVWLSAGFYYDRFYEAGDTPICVRFTKDFVSSEKRHTFQEHMRDAVRPVLERYWQVRYADQGIGLELSEKEGA